MKTTRSNRLFVRAQRFIPGGVDSPVRAFKSVGGSPLFIARASGSRLTDVDGNTFIDYVMSWGPLIHGHAPKGLAGAIARAARGGTSFGAPSPLEVDARRTRLPADAVDRARPLRQLRHRGRDERRSRGPRRHPARRHHQVPGVLPRPRRRLPGAGRFGRADLRHAGQPRRHRRRIRRHPRSRRTTISTRSGALFAAHRDRIAAVIVEPIAGNMGVVPPAEGFLRGLRSLCDRHGALLIFDEVISGFRAAPRRRAGDCRRPARPHVSRQDHRRRASGRRVRRARGSDGARLAVGPGVSGRHAVGESARDDGGHLVPRQAVAEALPSPRRARHAPRGRPGRRRARRGRRPAGERRRVGPHAVLHRATRARLRVGHQRGHQSLRSIFQGDAGPEGLPAALAVRGVVPVGGAHGERRGHDHRGSEAHAADCSAIARASAARST